MRLDIHHCQPCGGCIEGFDHHCSVLGMCIGQPNFRFFTLLVFYSGLSFVTFGLSAILYVLQFKYDVQTDKWFSLVPGAGLFLYGIIHVLSSPTIFISYIWYENGFNEKKGLQMEKTANEGKLDRVWINRTKFRGNCKRACNGKNIIFWIIPI